MTLTFPRAICNNAQSFRYSMQLTVINLHVNEGFLRWTQLRSLRFDLIPICPKLDLLIFAYKEHERGSSLLETLCRA